MFVPLLRYQFHFTGNQAQSHIAMKTKLEELSSLVLVDTLAALPREHVVRLAALGHERLRQLCSLKWVKERMTDDFFGVVMKKLNGKVSMVLDYHVNESKVYAALKLAKQATGVLHLWIRHRGSLYNDEPGELERMIQKFIKSNKISNLKYVSQCLLRGYGINVIQNFPEMVFDYQWILLKDCPLTTWNTVYYRPALLNGRHIVDVLRAVCGLVDVSEAEMDRIKQQANEWAKRYRGRSHLWRMRMPWNKRWEGVWRTSWEANTVTLHLKDLTPLIDFQY